MGTSVKELLKKLSKYDPDMEVIIEPNIDCMDAEMYGQQAYDVLSAEIEPITLYVSEAQSSRDQGDSPEEDYIEYAFDAFIDPLDKKKVLVISTPALKYGAKEDDNGD